MPRAITVTVQGYGDRQVTDPQSPPSWWADYKRIRRYPDCRIFFVKYKGEQVLLGALSRSMTTKDPWAGTAAGTTADIKGEVDFDQFLIGVTRNSPLSNPIQIRYVLYAKNRYWVMWVKYLLSRRQKGYTGSYETMLGAFNTAVSSRAANLYGRVTGLFRRAKASFSAPEIDAEEDMQYMQAQDFLDSLDDDCSDIKQHRFAVNF